MFGSALPAWLAAVLQLAGSAVAVLLLGGYTFLLWGRRSPPPLTAAEALDRFGREHPDEAPVEAVVLADGRTALVRTAAADALGVVSALGAGWTTRLLHPADIATVKHERPGQVRVRLRDFAQPALSLKFTSPDEEAAWLAGVAPS